MRVSYLDGLLDFLRRRAHTLVHLGPPNILDIFEEGSDPIRFLCETDGVSTCSTLSTLRQRSRGGEETHRRVTGSRTKLSQLVTVKLGRMRIVSKGQEQAGRYGWGVGKAASDIGGSNLPQGCL